MAFDERIGTQTPCGWQSGTSPVQARQLQGSYHGRSNAQTEKPTTKAKQSNRTHQLDERGSRLCLTCIVYWPGPTSEGVKYANCVWSSDYSGAPSPASSAVGGSMRWVWDWRPSPRTTSAIRICTASSKRRGSRPVREATLASR